MGYRLVEQVLDLRPMMAVSEWGVLLYFASAANEATGEVWTAAKTIAERMGLAEDNVKRARARLIRAGLMTDCGKRRIEMGARYRTVHVYSFNLDALQHGQSGDETNTTFYGQSGGDSGQSGDETNTTFQPQSGDVSNGKVVTFPTKNGDVFPRIYLEVPRGYLEPKDKTIAGATLPDLCRPHGNINFRSWLAERGPLAPAILRTVAQLVRRSDEDVRAMVRTEARFLEFALARFWTLWQPLTLPTHPCWPCRFADFVRRGADSMYRLSCGAHLWTSDGERHFAAFASDCEAVS